MFDERRINIVLINELNYSLTLKKVLILEGHSSGGTSGLIINAGGSWECSVECTRYCKTIRGKYTFKINGLHTPLSFAIKFEHINWKNKRGVLEFYNFDDSTIQFGHGNLGEKIGGMITGHTEENILKLTVRILSSTERTEKG